MSGPVLIAYDATPASAKAIREGATLLAGRPGLVLVVWKPRLAFDAIALPTSGIGLPAAPLDIRATLEAEDHLYDAARRAAEHGAQLAREHGVDAQPLVVADEPEIGVDETISTVASERGAQAVVVGGHAHGPIVGAIVRGVIKRAPCPVVVVRDRP